MSCNDLESDSPDCIPWPEDLASQEEAVFAGFIGWLSSCVSDPAANTATDSDARFALFNAGSVPVIALDAYLMRFQKHAKPGIEAVIQASCLIQRLMKV